MSFPWEDFRLKTALALVAVVLFQRISVAQSIPILNIDPLTQIGGAPGPGMYAGFNEAHGNGMVGWTFTLHQAVTVRKVAWYDEDQNGLSEQAQVGLWNGANQLLGNPDSGLFIPAGTSASLDGRWRTVDLLIPLQLQPGDYILGGLDHETTTDVIKYAHLLPTDISDPVLTGSRLTVGQFFYADMPQPQPGFHEPSNFYLLTGLELGPMLYIDVPEPAAFTLGAAAAVLCLRSIGRRTAKRSEEAER